VSGATCRSRSPPRCSSARWTSSRRPGCSASAPTASPTPPSRSRRSSSKESRPMAFETLRFAREESFVVVTLNRPPANAISAELMTELNGALASVEEDDAVRSVIITGAGDKIFCAGADLGSAFSGGSVDTFIRFGNGLGKEGETLDDARALARQIAKRPPIATRLIIEAVDEGLEAPIDKASEIEVRAFLRTLKTEDASEGIQAFFAKREPSFKGR